MKGGPDLAASKKFVEFFLRHAARDSIRDEGHFSLLPGLDTASVALYIVQHRLSDVMTLDVKWLSSNFARVRRESREHIVPGTSK